MDGFLVLVTTFSEVAVADLLSTDASVTGNAVTSVVGTEGVVTGVSASGSAKLGNPEGLDIAAGKTDLACLKTGAGAFSSSDSAWKVGSVAGMGNSAPETSDTSFASTGDTETGHRNWQRGER